MTRAEVDRAIPLGLLLHELLGMHHARVGDIQLGYVRKTTY